MARSGWAGLQSVGRLVTQETQAGLLLMQESHSKRNLDLTITVLYTEKAMAPHSSTLAGGAWKAAVHGVTKSHTGLSDFTFTFHCHALEKEMATHSNVLAWRIPGTRGNGGLPSMGLHRVGHN